MASNFYRLTIFLAVSAVIVLLLWFSIALNPWSVDLRKGPYLIYPGQINSMMVLWQCKGTSRCILQWGIEPDQLIHSVESDEYGEDHQHSYIINRLEPGLKYYYRLHVGENYYEGSFLAAIPREATQVSFIVYGDTRSQPAMKELVHAEMLKVIRQNPSWQTFAIHTGDWVSSGEEESAWDSDWFSHDWPSSTELLANLPIQGIMGNHEKDGSLFTKYYPYPFKSNRYWSFDYGPVHFSLLDQYTTDEEWQKQVNWLEQNLQSTDRPWKIVILHEPGFSTQGGYSANLKVVQEVQPLCAQYGVSLVFSGHDHFYVRSEVDGVQHIVSGGGGAPLRDPGEPNPHVVKSFSDYHFCLVHVIGDRLSLQVINTDGVVIDEVSITQTVSAN